MRVNLKGHIKGDSEFSSRKDPGKTELDRFPWWSTLPVQGAWLQSLVREIDPTCRD